MRWKRNKEHSPRLLPLDLRLLLAALILAFLGTIGFGLYQRLALSADLERLREAGKPLSLEEFHAQDHPSPEAIEAGAVFHEAFDAYVTRTDYETAHGLTGLRLRDDLPKDQPYENALKEAQGQFLAGNRRALLLFELACEYEDCYLHRQGAVADELRTSAKVLQLSQIASVGARLCAEDGDPVAAAQVLKLAFHANRVLALNPGYGSAFHRPICYKQAAEALMRVLSRATLGEAQLRELQIAALQQRDRGFVERALAWQRCEVIAWFLRRSESAGYWNLQELYPERRAKESVLRDVWEGVAGLQQLRLRQCLAYAEECEAALELTEAKNLTQLGRLDDRTTAIKNKLINPDWKTLGFFNCLRDWASTELRQRTVVTGIAIERYRLRHRSLPDTLDALAPEFLETVPLDPFTGKKPQYERLEPGYQVFITPSYWRDGRLVSESPIVFEVLR